MVLQKNDNPFITTSSFITPGLFFWVILMVIALALNSYAQVGPAGYTFCANEGETYTFNQVVDVAYGANSSFFYQYGVIGSITFDNASFGDPAPNMVKAGFYRIASNVENGQWIWQREDGPNNTWLCMRKKVSLSAKPTSAPVRIAAENKYWLYINGALVLPDGGLDVRPDLNNTYYDSLDIAAHLVAGENIIAILAWYKGGTNCYSQRMVGKGGLYFASNLTGATPATIVSDNTWKVTVHPSFERTTQGQQWSAWKWVSYSVNYDARNDIGDWTALSYDDASWAAATQKGAPPSAPWNELMPRTIPLWKEYERSSYINQSSIPAAIASNTTVRGNLGINTQGRAYCKLDAPAGVTVTIKMNEFYTQRYITKQGEQEFTTYQWQNTSGVPWSRHCVEYAFTNVSGTVRILDLKFQQSTYNTECVGTFHCNNEQLNTLWEKCKNTSIVCMRDIFYDCPDRERSQWWGDVSEQILYSFYLFDEKASLLAKKGFRELMNTQKADGSLYTTAPGNDFHLPDQNMAAVMSISDYFMYTGDTALVAELYPKMEAYIRNYVAGTRNSDGMLILQNGPWNWIDWGDNLDIQNGSANTVVNGLFVRLLETMKLCAQVSGNASDVSYYQGLQDAVKSRFDQYFWNSSARAYVFHRLNNTQSSTIDDRSNAWAVLAGAPDSEKQQGVLNILKTRFNAGPYQERYIEDAMFVMEKENDALIRMLTYYEPDIDSWSSTMWERMGNSSTNNHAWAASPCYLLGAYVVGIMPTTSGFSSYQVLPMMGSLTTVSADVPSVKGTISVRDTLDSDRFTMHLVSPGETRALVGIPKQYEWLSVTANGRGIWNRGAFIAGVTGITEGGENDRYIMFNVDPGTWQFTALMTPTELNYTTTVARQPALLIKSKHGQHAVHITAPGAYTLRIVDAMGRIVRTSRGTCTDTVTLKRNDLAQGVYFVHVQGAGKILMQKLVIF